MQALAPLSVPMGVAVLEPAAFKFSGIGGASGASADGKGADSGEASGSNPFGRGGGAGTDATAAGRLHR